MFDSGYGLGGAPSLSPEMQLRTVLHLISSSNGFFVFDISGVDIQKAKQGFSDFEEAESLSFITEWEL